MNEIEQILDDFLKGEKVSAADILAERMKGFRQALLTLKEETSKADEESAERGDALFKRVDELKTYYIQLVRDYEKCNALIELKASELQRTMEGKVNDLERKLSDKIKDMLVEESGTRVKMAVIAGASAVLLNLVLGLVGSLAYHFIVKK